MTILFMRSIKYFIFGFLFLIILGTLFLPLFVNAQTANTENIINANEEKKLELVFEPPCARIGITSFDSCEPIVDIQTYIKRLYQFAVGISGVVAVGMIVYGAIIIIVKSENVVEKSEGKEIIQDALWGVLLLFASYILLNTINPELVKLKGPAADKLKPPQNSQLTQLRAVSCGIATDIYAVNGNPIYAGNASSSPPITVNKEFEPNNRCGLRRVLFRHAYKIHDDLPNDYQDLDAFLNSTSMASGTEAKFYYREDEELLEDTIVWTYPYYIKGTDPKKTARCVIYARREPVGEDEDAVTKMIDLQQTLTPCILDDIPTSTIKGTFGLDYEKPVKQLPGWVWGNDPYGGCPEPPPHNACALIVHNECWKDKNDTVKSQARRICFAESGGVTTIPSGTDICLTTTSSSTINRPSVSWGLFQINISAHSFPNLFCANYAVSPMYTARNKICEKDLNYDKCVTAAQNGVINIAKACEIYKNAPAHDKWKDWGVNKKCKF